MISIRPTRGLAGREMTPCHHEEERLAEVEDLLLRQQRLVMDRGRDVVREGQVRSGQHRDHTRRCAHRREVHRDDLAACDIAQAEGEVQAAGRRLEVVDIARLAGDMQLRAVVGQGFRHAHAETSRTRVAAPMSSRK